MPCGRFACVKGVITPAEQLTELLKSLKEAGPWFSRAAVRQEEAQTGSQRMVIGLANGWAGEPKTNSSTSHPMSSKTLTQHW